MHKSEYGYFNPLYNLIELKRKSLSPWRLNLLAMQQIYDNPYNPYNYTLSARYQKAVVELLERVTRTYPKPEFGIDSCKIEGKTYIIKEEIEVSKPFCNLIHFSKKNFNSKLPKLLIVAPLAGHHSTLLRNTVEEMLPYADVYITDWIDASQVPLIYGKFDLDDYIDYLMEFMRRFDDRISIMAVCQPTIPVLAAVSLLSLQKSEHVPTSMILIGGPIDVRKNPTELNEFAIDQKLEWFQKNVITTVPANYPGAGRSVYPGFIQLSGFIGLNWEKHLQSHLELFNHILFNEENKIQRHKQFYDEYLAVIDLPAEFYLQTIEEVFQKFSLAKGKLLSRGRDANVKHITTSALLGIEGENDDIAAVGQTKAALDLCENIPLDKKAYYLQKGVGHYGVFSGSKFKEFIVPIIRDFIYKHAEEKK